MRTRVTLSDTMRLVIVILVYVASAQAELAAPTPKVEPAKRWVRGGAVFGVNLANASTNPDYGNSIKAGIAVGSSLEVPVSGRTYFAPELTYSEYGYNVTSLSAAASFRVVELAMLFKQDLSENTPVIPYLIAGPSFTYRISASQSVSGAVTDLSSVTNSFNCSLNFGLGVEVPLNADGGSLLFSGRYLMGLTNASSTPGNSAMQRTFQLTIGYVSTF